MIRVESRSDLWYVFPSNLTSGQSHANEKVTVRVDEEGMVTLAAMAAPILDPGFDPSCGPLLPSSSNDPCWNNISYQTIMCLYEDKI